MKKVVIILLILVLSSSSLFSVDDVFVVHKAKKGDGITTVLIKYGLPANNQNIEFFKEKNKANLKSNDGLFIGRKYFLPIKIYLYDGKSIRTTLGVNDLEYAKRVQKFNFNLLRKKIKKSDYRADNQLWIPVSEFSENLSEQITQSENRKAKELLPKSVTEPLFGEKYKNVVLISHLLSNCIFYLISGHGGPDPGAVGYKDGHELHEDEYAYDVTLRFARKLMENGAEVHIIVQDANDGIRDDKYLNNSSNEYHIGNYSISTSQNERLSKRAVLVNEMYQQNKSKSKKQFCIETHVDSRYTGQKVDIFFYYRDGNSEGHTLAHSLMRTIKDKYNKAQPGRGYEGSVTSRGLFMLRKVQPTSVFIEIGNIQNPRDQIRIIESNNRQAIANWLSDGFINVITGK
jgi:N-acetylmuramoyl-L-alanine amidase